MATKPGAPTSIDVARRAGVSRAAVSSVLNGARSTVRVAHDTRERIITAAAELGYQPDRAAQVLRRRRSGVIGFVPRETRGPMFEDVVPYTVSSHLSRVAIGRGLHVIEASAESHESRSSDETLRFMLGWRVDGVILDVPMADAEVRRFLDAGVPVVQILRPLLSVPTPIVTVDPRPGIGEAIDHLVALGHRRIAFIGSADASPIDTTRIDAFRQALAAHGLPVPDEMTRLMPSYLSDFGQAAMSDFLRLPEDRRPTAVIAGGDPLALGALRAAHDARVRVPDDLSVVSYDDAIAANLIPPLTSVAQPFDAVAERALDLLADERATAPGDDAPRVSLPSAFRVRGSTSRVPATTGRPGEG